MDIVKPALKTFELCYEKPQQRKAFKKTYDFERFELRMIIMKGYFKDY